jgi:hypothetical protein
MKHVIRGRNFLLTELEGACEGDIWRSADLLLA